MNSWRVFTMQFRRDWLLNCRNKQQLLNSALFFMMIMVFFPLTIPAHSTYLKQLAPGLIWVTVLLAQLLCLERLYKQDLDDGVIEQWLLEPGALVVIVSAKIAVHWLLTIVPLLLYCPFIAFLFDFNLFETAVLALSLCLGSPAILYLSALVAATGNNAAQQGAYMALLLLPLAVPVMIFGSNSMLVAQTHLLPISDFAMLFACSLLALCFLPFAIATIIRVSLVD